MARETVWTWAADYETTKRAVQNAVPGLFATLEYYESTHTFRGSIHPVPMRGPGPIIELQLAEVDEGHSVRLRFVSNSIGVQRNLTKIIGSALETELGEPLPV